MIIANPILSGSIRISGSLLVNDNDLSDGGGNIVTGSFTNSTSSTVTHNFNTKAIMVQVWDSNDYVIVPSTIQANSLNQVTVTFDSPESGIIVVGK
jgi:hypothetical protein